MVPISNKVYDLVPNICAKYPLVLNYVDSETTISILKSRYDTFIGNPCLPKGVYYRKHGLQLATLLEECFSLLGIEYKYTLDSRDDKGVSTVIKNYQILRGGFAEVVGNKSGDDISVRAAMLYAHLIQSATRRGLPFNLTLTDCKRLSERKTCFFLDTPFTETGEFKRTVDRLDCNKGYVKGNVVACTHMANQMKNHFFEHSKFDHNHIDKLFYKWFTLIADGKIQPKTNEQNYEN